MVFIAVWQFNGNQFSTFWDGNSLQVRESERKPVFGCISHKDHKDQSIFSDQMKIIA